MQAIAVASNLATWSPSAPELAGAPLGYSDFAPAAPLRVRFFRSAKERQAIADLRRLSAFGVEQDLGLDLQSFEQTRDEIGLVTAAYRGDRPVATLRLVPTGHGLTGAERLHEKVHFDGRILEEGSWEIGRVIMQPEDRHPELLIQCLRSTLEAVMEREYVRDFHATTTLAMARLWRRVGMRTVLTTTGASGTRYCLVHGRVEDVAAALQVGHAGVDRSAQLAPELLAGRPAAPGALHA